ncbi:uncharacterized protein LOC144094888 [Amblyomma americanum]
MRKIFFAATEASAKFKNARDRWLKIVSGTDATCRSGAPGNGGNATKKWALFPLMDGMLRSTPHYASRITTNVPKKTWQSPGPSQRSGSGFATPESTYTSQSSPGMELLEIADINTASPAETQLLGL